MDDKNTSEDNLEVKSDVQAIRESLVNTAVQFLSNPSLRSSPLNAKLEFLKKKGMTEQEIEIAVQRSGAREEIRNQGPLYGDQSSTPAQYRDQVAINIPSHLQTIPSNHYYPYHQQLKPLHPITSTLIWLRELANSIITLGGAAYLVYWFYKNYIEPYLFGKKKKEIKKDPVKTELVKLKDTIERVSGNVERLDQKLDFACQRNQIEDQELISHIISLKGLLLSRKQFPPTPATTVAGSAAIPAWQLSEGQALSSEEGNKKVEGSPSNSSSNSTNTDGTSDSSLEVIKDQEIINTK